MTTNRFQKVTSASSLLQATYFQVTLELAGIPAEINPSSKDAYIEVLVPESYLGDALQLFYGERPAGERYLLGHLN